MVIKQAPHTWGKVGVKYWTPEIRPFVSMLTGGIGGAHFGLWAPLKVSNLKQPLVLAKNCITRDNTVSYLRLRAVFVIL